MLSRHWRETRTLSIPRALSPEYRRTDCTVTRRVILSRTVEGMREVVLIRVFREESWRTFAPKNILESILRMENSKTYKIRDQLSLKCKSFGGKIREKMFSGGCENPRIVRKTANHGAFTAQLIQMEEEREGGSKSDSRTAQE